MDRTKSIKQDEEEEKKKKEDDQKVTHTVRRKKRGMEETLRIPRPNLMKENKQKRTIMYSR